MFKLRAIYPFFKQREIEALSLSQAVDKFKKQVGVMGLNFKLSPSSSILD